MTDTMINLDDPVDFSYPDGYEKLMQMLDFLPSEEEKAELVLSIASFFVGFA